MPIGAAALALVASGVIALVSRLRRSGRETIILLGIALVFGFQALRHGAFCQEQLLDAFRCDGRAL